MSDASYEMLSLLMRYVFLALGVVILLRSYRWLRRDDKAYRREIESLPDAGLVGEVVDMNTGESFPLPREGTIGSGRACDIRLRSSAVAARHASFLFVDGKGLVIRPLGGHYVALDGEPVTGSGCALHGTRLEIGDITLRVRLFAGLNVPRRAVYAPDDGVLSPAEDPELDALLSGLTGAPGAYAPLPEEEAGDGWHGAAAPADENGVSFPDGYPPPADAPDGHALQNGEEQSSAFVPAQDGFDPFSMPDDPAMGAGADDAFDMNMTWPYAPFPDADGQDDPTFSSPSSRRTRRSRRRNGL